MLHAPARRHVANTERVADHGQIRRTLGPLRGPSIVDTIWNPLHAPAQLLEEANEHAAKAERAVNGFAGCSILQRNCGETRRFRLPALPNSLKNADFVGARSRQPHGNLTGQPPNNITTASHPAINLTSHPIPHDNRTITSSPSQPRHSITQTSRHPISQTSCSLLSSFTLDNVLPKLISHCCW